MKKIITRMDKPLFFLIMIFCIFGLIMVFSSSTVSAILRYNYSSTHFFTRQLLFMLIAIIFGVAIILRLPTSRYKLISWAAILGINACLVMLLVYGGFTNHVQSWFYIGPMSIQPSEFAKSIIIIFMATYYNSLFRKKNLNIFKVFIPIAFAAMAFFLTALQPDFGSAAIIAGITFLTFISLPMNKNNVMKVIKAGAFIVVIIGFVVLYSDANILNESQLGRLNFRKPCTRYTDDSGYQVCNGFIAINNGGLLGVGLGNSTQKYLYLPESHTDFIFAIIVEELGVIVGIAVILLYILLLYRILKIAKEAHSLRNSILAYGTFWYLALHIIINLSGILGLCPLTGVPLPLLSYGGSHTLNVLGMLFIVLRVSVENKTAQYQNEIRKLAN